MQHDILALPNRGRLAGACLLYAAVMLYSSTIVGPAGVNFVPLDPVGAFHAFLATPYVHHGSDQRADWIGNLLMLVPYGFLISAALWPRRAMLWPLAALGAMVIAVATILAIKYLQLFFPPRTVTLNYILAQSLGALAGCAGYAIWHRHLGQSSGRRDLVGTFVAALWLYAGALFLFTLMPLDFALNATDLRAMMARFPETLLVLPGEGRSLAVRAVLISMGSAAFIPVGMLLTFSGRGLYRVRRGLWAVGGIGLIVTSVLFLLNTLILSALPSAASVLYRTAGVIVGGAALHWLVRQDLAVLRARLRAAVPWVVVPYLGCVMLVNRLVSVHWLTFHAVVGQAYPLGLIPLFDYYIVTKGEAAKNIIGHAVLYMPVGVLLWLRYGRISVFLAFSVAALLSLAVEIGRYFRPGLEGDINAVAVAGLAGMAAIRLMPGIWAMVEALRRQTRATAGRRWDTRQPGSGGAQPLGEIEHF